MASVMTVMCVRAAASSMRGAAEARCAAAPSAARSAAFVRGAAPVPLRAASRPAAAAARPRGAVCGALVEKLTAEQLEQAIQERSKPMVIDFFATWCGPCLLLATELEKVAKDMEGKVRIVKVDTDEEPELATQLQIQGLPTMVFLGLDPAKPALRTEGLLPADVIKEIIEKEL